MLQFNISFAAMPGGWEIVNNSPINIAYVWCKKVA